MTSQNNAAWTALQGQQGVKCPRSGELCPSQLKFFQISNSFFCRISFAKGFNKLSSNVLVCDMGYIGLHKSIN